MRTCTATLVVSGLIVLSHVVALKREPAVLYSVVTRVALDSSFNFWLRNHFTSSCAWHREIRGGPEDVCEAQRSAMLAFFDFLCPTSILQHIRALSKFVKSLFCSAFGLNALPAFVRTAC